MNEELVTVLKAARSSMETEDLWYHGPTTVEVRGVSKRCLVTAYDNPAARNFPVSMGELYLDAITAAIPVDWEPEYNWSLHRIFNYNDEHTHAEALAVLDRAIETASNPQ